MSPFQEKVAVGFAWEKVGEITVDRTGKLLFPKVGTNPSLYRFHFTAANETSVYIGEAENIYRRLQHYRNPGPSQRTNIRLNEMLLGILAGGTKVFFCTISEAASIALAGNTRKADLSKKHERVFQEHAAICEAYEQRLTVLNL